MHETHLIKPVIEGIEKHASLEGAKRVSKVKLKVGDLACTREESFKETFKVLAKGTILEGAKLELIFFPGTSRVEVVSFDID